jgi:hypothetical protein
MTKNEPIPTTGPTIKRIVSDDYKEIYSNTSALRVTPWDVAFVFSHQRGLGGDVVIEDQIAVTLSPPQFKSFVKAVDNTLIAFEANFGEINVKEQFMKQPTPELLLNMFAKSMQITGEVKS